MEKTKQNKHRGNITPAGAALGQTSQGGRDATRKSNGERGRKQNRETERVKEKILQYCHNKIKEILCGEKQIKAAVLCFSKES